MTSTRTLAELRAIASPGLSDEEYLRLMVGDYYRSDWDRGLLEFTGMSPDEFAEWFTSGVVPERVMRVAGRRPAGQKAVSTFPPPPVPDDDEVYIHVYSERDEMFGYVRFVAYWRGPLPGGGPLITRGQVFRADERPYIRNALEDGKRVFWWPSGEEVTEI